MKVTFQHIIKAGLLSVVVTAFFLPTGCARIVPPSGGPKDTLPPVLVGATPKDSVLNSMQQKITLTFDEYVQIDNAVQNVFVNPVPKNIASIEAKLKTVTIRLKDTLQPNTTYSIDFGNALKDINEGNPLKKFTYVFSTGDHLDNGSFAGRVLLANTGKTDSTLIVILHRSQDDSAVVKETPRYVTRLDSAGRFRFNYLAPGTYSIYALKDAGGQKKYIQKTELFAFYDRPVTVGTDRDSIRLYAYAEAPEKTKPSTSGNKSNAKKKEENPHLRISTNLENNKLDLLSPFIVTIDKPVPKYDSTKIHLTDTLNNQLSDYYITPDTSFTKFTIHYAWKPDVAYRLIFEKSFGTDTAGVALLRNDTIRIQSKKESEYGSIALRFHGFDLAKHPVLQLLQSDKVVDSIRITSNQYSQALYRPGDYDLRILFDTNDNGTWDPGAFFGKHLQPEMVVTPRGRKKLSVRTSWDNGYDIDL